MCKMACDDGIKHIVATPHFRYGERPSAADIAEKLALLKEKVAQEGLPLELSAGADIHLTFELLSGIEKRDIPSINSSRYFLLELPDFIPPALEKFLFNSRACGYIPVITHPERNYSLLSAPKKMSPMRDAGALFQVTAMSITGEFGGPVRSFVRSMFRNDYVDFVATDAHSPVERRPLLSKAFSEVSGLCGEKKARAFFFDNPSSVVGNRELAGV